MPGRLEARRAHAAVGLTGCIVGSCRADSSGRCARSSGRRTGSARRAGSARRSRPAARAGGTDLARRAKLRNALLAAAAVVLSGCVTIPDGPAVMVLPGSTKTFDQFRADDGECRGYATAQIGGKSAQQAANQSAATSAAVGTAVGAGAGALIGGGQGAAVGAGVGLAGGSLVGADTAYSSGRTTQQRYDQAYLQCMYARGHQIPMARGALPRQVRSTAATPPMAPPPPPGSPPPPPAGYRVN